MYSAGICSASFYGGFEAQSVGLCPDIHKVQASRASVTQSWTQNFIYCYKIVHWIQWTYNVKFS